MKSFSEAHQLIDAISEHCARNRVSHEGFLAAMLLALYSDMRANPAPEHNLTDNDGVLLLNVRLME